MSYKVIETLAKHGLHYKDGIRVLPRTAKMFEAELVLVRMKKDRILVYKNQVKDMQYVPRLVIISEEQAKMMIAKCKGTYHVIPLAWMREDMYNNIVIEVVEQYGKEAVKYLYNIEED